MISDAIEYFEIMRAKCVINLKNCQSKQSRLPEEERNIKRKLEAITLALNALEYMNKKNIDTCNWMSDLQNANWGD